MDVWNISSSHKEQPSKEELWMGEMPKYSKKLRTFGEISIVKELGITGHAQNKGYDALFLGYDKESTRGVFRMLKLKTWNICVSRDVTWLNMNYKQYKQKELDPDTENSESSIKIVEAYKEDKIAKEEDESSVGLLTAGAKMQLEDRMKIHTEEHDSEILLEGNMKLRDEEPEVEESSESSDSKLKSDHNEVF